jgi:hypothetical protein
MNPITAYFLILGLVGLGLAGVLFSRLRPGMYGRRLRYAGAALLVLGFLAVVSLLSTILWDGGYGQAEFQITFQDADKQSIQGVELRVEDREGHTFYHYPVTDYLPGQIPTSDHDGVMVFHHAGSGIEFSGRCWLLFGLIPVEERRGPVFICRFLHQGREVYRIRFGELDSLGGTWEQMPKVKRRWKRSGWPMSQLLTTEGEDYDGWNSRARKFFDLDGDGKLNPEEGAAYHAGTDWRNEEAAIARLKGEDPEEEMEFPVVRRTLTIRTGAE